MSEIETPSIERFIHDWILDTETLADLIPQNSLIVGDVQDDDLTPPYATIDAETETDWRTNTGRGDRAEVMIMGWFNSFQEGKNWAKKTEDRLDNQTRADAEIKVKHFRRMGYSYEQEENGDWRFDVPFMCKYHVLV